MEEFARIWKKDPKDLSQLDYFIFLLINDLDSQLQKGYFAKNPTPENYKLNADQISELAVQLGDGLQFFYEQICFGKGCSLGCPNKLDKPFTKSEDNVRLVIINEEFNGVAESCASREDCFRHDLMNYVVKDTLIDFYTYFENVETNEDDPVLLNMATFIVGIIIRFTTTQGGKLLSEPDKKVDSILT